MIRLKSAADIETLARGGAILARVVKEVAAAVAPGVTTQSLNDLAADRIAAAGGRPSFLNYRPDTNPLAYPASLCVSINDEIVHGIPSPRTIASGDVVTIDLGLEYEGRFTDHAVTVIAGRGSHEDQALVWATAEALAAGIAAATVGATTGDIGAAIAAVAKRAGLGVVRDLSGHGVGFRVHEEPFVPNFGKPGSGVKLKPGLVIAIEPMFTRGGAATELLDDGFTFITADGSRAAHFEHTIAVTETGPRILTAL